MAIVTRHPGTNYAAIPNAVLEHETLSFEARGLLCYLLAKPADWSVNVSDLERAGGIGRDKVYRLLNALIDARYVDRRERRGADGRVREVEYLIYDQPIGAGRSKRVAKPLPEKPEAVKPEAETPLPDFPDTENTDALLKTQTHQIPTREKRAGEADLFGNAQPAKGQRQGCHLPDGFQPDLSAALAEGLTQAEAEREAKRFADYWLGIPGKDGRKADWPATWRNWVRRAVDQRPRHRAPVPSSSATNPKAMTVGQLAAQRLAERRASDVPAITH